MPSLKKLKDELESVNTEYSKLSAERKYYKEESRRLGKLAQQKRDSQKTIKRFLENEQQTKRKKNHLE